MKYTLFNYLTHFTQILVYFQEVVSIYTSLLIKSTWTLFRNFFRSDIFRNRTAAFYQTIHFEELYFCTSCSFIENRTLSLRKGVLFSTIRKLPNKTVTGDIHLLKEYNVLFLFPFEGWLRETATWKPAWDVPYFVDDVTRNQRSAEAKNFFSFTFFVVLDA